MPRMSMRDSQAALGFLISQVTNIEAEVYKTKYPAIQYPDLIPVVTQGNEWAKSTTFFSMDSVGKADWISALSTDMPMADVVKSISEHGFAMAGIGYRYNIEEINTAMMVPGTNLQADRASAAKLASEQYLDNLALRGDTTKNMKGFINDDAVTAVDAASTGTGSATEWASKTADLMMDDVNDALSGVYTESRTVEMANTILLPTAEMLRLSKARLSNLDKTALSFLKENNILTNQTGEPLTIRGVRGLETAGEGGTQRMIAYRRDPSVVRFHLPMPHRFWPVFQTNWMTFDIPGTMRTGGTEIRRPGAVRYVDKI